MLCLLVLVPKLRNINNDAFSAVINHHKLERVHSTKCLGVIIDDVLNWHKHVNSVIQKVFCNWLL